MVSAVENKVVPLPIPGMATRKVLGPVLCRFDRPVAFSRNSSESSVTASDGFHQGHSPLQIGGKSEGTETTQ